MKILEDSIEKLSHSELQDLARNLGLKNFSGITPEALVGIFQAVFRAGGFKSYQLTLIIVNYIMKAILGRGLSLAGPIGWTITGLWTAIDIAGPAYRVTIPAVIHVAVLRQKYLYDEKARDVSFG
ncbi:TPA: YaaW family protein [Neisseria lactamica]